MKIKMKRCPQCGTVLPCDAKECYNCLHEFVRKQKKKNVKTITFKNISPKKLCDWLSLNSVDIINVKWNAYFTEFLTMLRKKSPTSTIS